MAEARTGDVYLMCMCGYRTPGRACHTYALLDLARELDPTRPGAARARPARSARGQALTSIHLTPGAAANCIEVKA